MSTTAEKIAVMKAFERGETIESRFSRPIETDWIEVETPSWNFAHHDYRVKPNPREWWVNFYSGERAWVHESEEHAHTSAGSDVLECIHLREVLP